MNIYLMDVAGGRGPFVMNTKEELDQAFRIIETESSEPKIFSVFFQTLCQGDKCRIR
ncbi:MAG: hypothetical protein SCK57_11585 [Bacillota bacterium]|nr:hypothetical protein [Bacillota bacterium]